jgi:hypothetical protein
MADTAVLDPTQSLPPCQDFDALRAGAVADITAQCGDGWSDMNPSEPGGTLLEAALFAMTDLGYRLDYPMADLLAPAPTPTPADPLPGPAELLPSSPVTDADLCALMLDDEGIDTIRIDSLPFDRGIRNRQLVFAPADRDIGAADTLKTRQRLWRSWQANRPLGQTIVDIRQLSDIGFGIQASLVLNDDAEVDGTVAELLWQWLQAINRRPRFSDRASLLAGGLDNATVFDGPLLAHGYLSPEERQRTPRTVVFVSEMVDIALGVSGIAAVQALNLVVPPPAANAPSPLAATGNPWNIELATSHATDHYFRFDVAQTLALLQAKTAHGLPSLTRNGKTLRLNPANVQQRFDSLRAAAEASTPAATPGAAPAYRGLSRYRPLSYELPPAYGLNASGVAPGSTPLRLAQARQLQAFLLLLEQTLADQFAQLDAIRDLFAMPAESLFADLERLFADMLAGKRLCCADIALFWHTVGQWPATHRRQPVAGLKTLPDLLGPADLADWQDPDGAPYREAQLGPDWLDRQQRRLTHLLSCFGEEAGDPTALRYGAVFSHYAPLLCADPKSVLHDPADMTRRLTLLKQIVDLARWLRDLPVLAGQRGQGADVGRDMHNRSGLERRIAARLGIHLDRQLLSMANREGFYLVEGAQLCMGPQPSADELAALTGSQTGPDAWMAAMDTPAQLARCQASLYFLFPLMPSRFASAEFRQLVESVVQDEAPAHLRPVVIWLPRKLMHNAEVAYRHWRARLATAPMPSRTDPAPASPRQVWLDKSANALRKVLQKLDPAEPLGPSLTVDWSQWSSHIGHDAVNVSLTLDPRRVPALNTAWPIGRLTDGLTPPGDFSPHIGAEPRRFAVNFTPALPLTDDETSA